MLITRYESKNAQLAADIAAIQTAGAAIGREIDQLKAVRAATSTQNHFVDVLDGLYKATPQGVSYSQIDLNDDGILRLRAQAKSLSLLLVLPESLEGSLIS